MNPMDWIDTFALALLTLLGLKYLCSAMTWLMRNEEDVFPLRRPPRPAARRERETATEQGE